MIILYSHRFMLINAIAGTIINVAMSVSSISYNREILYSLIFTLQFSLLLLSVLQIIACITIECKVLYAVIFGGVLNVVFYALLIAQVYQDLNASFFVLTQFLWISLIAFSIYIWREKEPFVGLSNMHIHCRVAVENVLGMEISPNDNRDYPILGTIVEGDNFIVVSFLLLFILISLLGFLLSLLISMASYGKYVNIIHHLDVLSVFAFHSFMCVFLYLINLFRLHSNTSSGLKKVICSVVTSGEILYILYCVSQLGFNLFEAQTTGALVLSEIGGFIIVFVINISKCCKRPQEDDRFYRTLPSSYYGSMGDR